MGSSEHVCPTCAHRVSFRDRSRCDLAEDADGRVAATLLEGAWASAWARWMAFGDRLPGNIEEASLDCPRWAALDGLEWTERREA